MTALGSAAWLLLALALAPPAVAAGEAPAAVAPGSPTELAGVASACPTFHWGLIPGARAYELIVYRVGEEAEPVLRRTLPGAVGGWTPALEECLEPGGEYAWTVRARGRQSPTGWSAPRLFRVEGGGAAAELATALAEVRELLASAGPAAVATAAPSLARGLSPVERLLGEDAPETGRPAPTTPALSATPSLQVDNQIHLGAASDFFRGGPLGQQVFLWADNAADNVSLGRLALSFNTTGIINAAFGSNALYSNTTGSRNTATGAEALAQNLTGSYNTASGFRALRNTSGGDYNTAIGHAALISNSGSRNTAGGNLALSGNSMGMENTAFGGMALGGNNGGSRNTAIGYRAGYNIGDAYVYVAGGDDNIFIGSGAEGTLGDTHTIRIGGTAVGTAAKQQNRTFINGIRGITVANSTAVLIDANTGQLGTVASSRRYKEDIADMAVASARLLDLRPVTFRFREPLPDGGKPLQYGLVAEEVAAVFPELVIYDGEGRPETVRYHLLATLLLNELQKQERRLAAQAAELARLGELEARLALLERRPRAGGEARPPD